MTRILDFVTSGKGLTFFALLATLTLGIALGPIISEGVFSFFQDTSPSSRLVLDDDDAKFLATQDVANLAEGFRRVATTFEPFVVNVSTRSIQRGSTRSGTADLFDQLFKGGAPAGPREVRSLGSGTIVDPKGFIITNSHVVTLQDQRSGEAVEADRIEVNLSNGETLTARVVGFDAQADIAVLKIEAATPLQYASIGDTSKMQIGDWVLAIGSPFGLEQTVTAGIVSAKGRPGDRFGGGANLFGDYLQTDAAINPGNSGGPLVNMKGQLIGINTFISTRSGGSQGIGFAIPSHVFINAYNQLVATGRIERGWIGISMNLMPLTPEMAEYFGVAGSDSNGLKDGDGVLVTDLISEDNRRSSRQSPAAEAGIRAEDVIVRIGEREIESAFDLRSIIASTPPGETLPVTVVRKGEIKSFDVTLARRRIEELSARNNRSLSFDEEPTVEEKPREIGLSIRTLTEQEVSQARVPTDEESRVLIEEVEPGSLADDAGLGAGQIITHINGKAVINADDLYGAVKTLKPGEAAILRGLDSQNGFSIFYTSFVKP